MVWRKEMPQKQPKKVSDKKDKEPVQVNYVALMREKVKTRSRLSDLSLLVDTGGYYQVQN